MNNREPSDQDHWEMFAESMDLTIEGHRLIAQEIVYETRLLWRTMGSRFRGLIGILARFRGLIGIVARRRATPPA